MLTNIMMMLPDNPDCCCCCTDKQLADPAILGSVLREYCSSKEAGTQAAAQCGSGYTHSRGVALALVQQQP
jgi:hypothetical protein